MTVIDHWTGASATAMRLAMRLTNERFAERLGISVRAVAKWRAQPDLTPSPLLQQVLDTVLERCDATTVERFNAIVAGRAFGEIPRQSRYLYSRLHGTEEDLLDFQRAVPNAQVANVPEFRGEVSDDEEMLRRQFLSTSAAALTGAVLAGITGSGKAPRLNAANVTELETVTEAHRGLYHSLPARSIWSSVEGHLRLLINLVRAPQSELVHRRLAALGGEAAGLLAWLALDLGDERAREWLHDIALSLTAEAEDRQLDAYVRGFRSQVRQLEGRPRAALALADQAVATTGTGREGSVNAWLRSRQAVALAEVKDGRGSLVALAAAEAALARGTGEEPAWMYEFDEIRLAAERGDCLLRLDHPEQAEQAFREALAAPSTKAAVSRLNC